MVMSKPKPKLIVVRVPSTQENRDHGYWVYRKYFMKPSYGWVREVYFTTAKEAFDYVDQRGVLYRRKRGI